MNFLTKHKFSLLMSVTLITYFMLHALIEIKFTIAATNWLLLFANYLVINLVAIVVLHLFKYSSRNIFIILFIINTINFFSNPFQDFLNNFISKEILSFKLHLIMIVLIYIPLLFFVLKRIVKSEAKFTFGLAKWVLFLIVLDVIIYMPQIKKKQATNVIGIKNKKSVYVLLFDEYAASSVLKHAFNFNNPLDKTLTNNGFTVYSNATANYNATRASVASFLNAQYVNLDVNEKTPTQNDYLYCLKEIKQNNLFKTFKANGYKCINNSIFDIDQAPSIVNSRVFPQESLLISQRTLLSRIRKLVLPEMQKHSFFQKITGHNYTQQIKDNNYSLKMTKAVATTAGPKLVYAHFLMPHLPFYKDSLGKDIAFNEYTKDNQFENEQLYLSFLKYVNIEIEALTKAIIKNDKEAQIVILSDHGYRTDKFKNNKVNYFKNYLATYNIPLLTDSISAPISLVNFWNLYYNKTNGLKLPVVRDSAIFIKGDH